MEAYQAGLIDRTEALMKTDIFDKEGVLKRMDLVQQLQQQLQQAQEAVKNLQGDLQTANRLAVGKLENAVKLEAEKLRLRGQSQEKQEKLQRKGE